MNSTSMIRPAAGLILVAAAACLACPGGVSQPVTEPAIKPAPPPAVEQQSPPEPVPPPPSPAMLALAACTDAEARGDYARAISILEGALKVTNDPTSLGDLHFRTGILLLSPDNPARDPKGAIQRLQSVTQIKPAHPRSRDARVLLALVADLDRARSDSLMLQEEQDRLRAEIVTLRADLERKDQELEKIKRALLDKQP